MQHTDRQTKAHHALKMLQITTWSAIITLSALSNVYVRYVNALAGPTYIYVLTPLDLVKYTVSQKNCANLFLSELRQISTNFDNLWQNDGKEAKIMRGALIFHLTYFASSHYRVKSRCSKLLGYTTLKLLSAINFLTT